MPDTSLSGLLHAGSRIRSFRWRVPCIEANATLLEYVQTASGRILLFILAGVLLKFMAGPLWLWVTVAAAVVAYAGPRRYFAAMVCTGVLLARAPEWIDFRAVYAAAETEAVQDSVRLGVIRAATLLACAPVALGLICLERRFRDCSIARHPLLVQHFLYGVLLGLAASPLLHGVAKVVLWSVVAIYGAYFWFLAYALLDQRQRAPAPLLLHLASFHPFFGSTMVPVGKGAAAWRNVEARSAEELAVTQLKGLKLLGWAFFLKAFLWLYRKVVYGKLGIPSLEFAFERFVQDGISPGPLGALSIVANFFEQLLFMAVWGHVIVGAARLAGFRLLRNTYRPLSSRTIAEFWNRYFYYFKEILVHVYFYPTYVRWFRTYPRLRIAFATFMAAGVGNWFFHFMIESHQVARSGLVPTIAYMQTYAFYCAMLVGAIMLSQLRTRRPDPGAGWLRRRFLPPVGVALFYCFLSFFDGPQRHAPLADHFAFLFEILGASRW